MKQFIIDFSTIPDSLFIVMDLVILNKYFKSIRFKLRLVVFPSFTMKITRTWIWIILTVQQSKVQLEYWYLNCKIIEGSSVDIIAHHINVYYIQCTGIKFAEGWNMSCVVDFQMEFLSSFSLPLHSFHFHVIEIQLSHYIVSCISFYWANFTAETVFKFISIFEEWYQIAMETQLFIHIWVIIFY